MKYVLILGSGKVMVFTVKAVAELYNQIYGGTLVSTIACQVNIDRLSETV